MNAKPFLVLLLIAMLFFYGCLDFSGNSNSSNEQSNSNIESSNSEQANAGAGVNEHQSTSNSQTTESNGTSSGTIEVNNSFSLREKPVIEYFEASDTEIEKGDVVTLSWKVDNADSVELSSYGTVGLEGSVHVSPRTSKTYVLAVSKGPLTITKSIYITVTGVEHSCTTYYQDKDGDGFGTIGKCLDAPQGDFTALKPNDCNDNNPNVHPGALDVCDGIDNNCNEEIDEDNWLRDGAEPNDEQRPYKIFTVTPSDINGTGILGEATISPNNDVDVYYIKYSSTTPTPLKATATVDLILQDSDQDGEYCISACFKNDLQGSCISKQETHCINPDNAAEISLDGQKTQNKPLYFVIKIWAEDPIPCYKYGIIAGGKLSHS